MKISEKLHKRGTSAIVLFPIIYYIISDTFHANKYIKFLMVVLIFIYTVLLDIGYRFTNNLIEKKKDIIKIILWILFNLALVVWWYFKFVHL